tara:strand:- start:69 stop:392 length:324 start_codon:yes stop_codon:yes gene_type:complete
MKLIFSILLLLSISFNAKTETIGEIEKKYNHHSFTPTEFRMSYYLDSGYKIIKSSNFNEITDYNDYEIDKFYLYKKNKTLVICEIQTDKGSDYKVIRNWELCWTEFN